MSTGVLSRREWLKAAGIALGALAIPVGCGKSQPQTTHNLSPAFNPSAWLSVDSEGRVKVTVTKSEMGQGVRTTLAMVVADELGARWGDVSVEQADTDARFGERSTGGSSSLEDSWLSLRTAAAAARAMLIQAAASRWQVAVADCRAEAGRVAHPESRRELPFGSLAADASRLALPADPTLKRPEDFRLIGQRLQCVDTTDILSGRAIYGMDVAIPGMHYAVIARCPFLDGTLKTFDDAAAVAVRGVTRVIVVPHQDAGHAAAVRPGVAVIAKSSYAALKGRNLLSVQWQAPARPLLDTAGVYETLKSMRREGARTVISRNRIVAGIQDGERGERAFEADYLVPYAAHAAMEPLSCTALVRGKFCEIWAGTQSPTNTQRLVARALGIASHRVVIHNQLLGGGFGRRLNADFIVEGALVSKAINAPVKVTWSREDDLQNDFYRPASYHSLTARVNKDNRLVSWHHLIVGPSTVRQIDGVNTARPERQEIVGLELLPYEIPRYRVDYLENDPARIPIGWWRGIANTENLLAVECFMSEIAGRLGIDPIEFRLRHISDERLRRVVEAVRDRFEWEGSAPSGSAYGFAACNYHGRTRVALAIEAAGRSGSALQVRRALCVVDCGLVVNPSVVEAQIEGGIAWGLSAALMGEVTIAEGRVAVANFNDYPVLRMAEAPHIDVYLIDSHESPSGVGESVVPIVAPALAAAAARLAHKRIDRLPIRL
jgi:isoquinoline 1-oxidoreductase subunit beta